MCPANVAVLRPCPHDPSRECVLTRFDGRPRSRLVCGNGDDFGAVASREERLAELPVEISIGADKRRRVPLGRLRGFVRPVVAAGSAADVDAVVTKALGMRDALEEKAVVICPVILDQFSSADGRSIPELVDGWRGGGKVICVPVNVRLWRAWIERQMQIAGVDPDRGVYLSLRMDGRVRASGKGMPPLERIAASLPPAEAWSGFLSGFDGSVNPLQ